MRHANLANKQDNITIAHFEVYLEQNGFPDSPWVTDLVTNAHDQQQVMAYLDLRIPQIIVPDVPGPRATCRYRK